MSLDPDKVVHSPFSIGALGALVTAFRFMPGKNWVDRVVNVVTGSVTSGLTTPAFVEWLHHDSSQAVENVAAFAIGLLGMSLAAAIMEWLRSPAIGEIIDSWLRRRPPP